MTTAQQDYFAICNPENVPDFDGRFCVRCAQRECTRSIVNKTSFEKRVSNWEERLFNSPPVLPEDDPRYQAIASQKFVSLTRVQGQPSQWVDPNDVQEQTVEAPPAVPEAPVIKPESIKTTIPVRNTPVKGKQMLSGNAPPPVLDPWQPKQPLSSGETLVSKGAKVRLS